MEFNTNNLTEHEIILKAAGINFNIFLSSVYLKAELDERIKEFKNIKQEDSNEMFFIISYVLLFQVQKNFWEKRIMKSEEDALVFEKQLYKMFEMSSGKDSTPFIEDIGDYIERIGKTGEIQYIGSKLCNEILNKKDAILMFEIVAIFSSFLTNVFHESIKKSFNDLPNDLLERILKDTENDRKMFKI